MEHDLHLILPYEIAFFHHSKMATHGKSIVSVRAGNVIGGGDYADNRIIPDIIRSLENNEEIVLQWVDKMVELDIEVISLADTVGVATASQVSNVLKAIIPKYKNTTIGVHLHSSAVNWKNKVDAALQAGCKRFDGALKGIGGCPMANDELVGNMDTELMIPYFDSLNLLNGLDMEGLKKCSRMAGEIFI